MVRPFVIFFFLALMSLSVEAATSGTSQPMGDYPRVATVDWTLVETLMSLGVVPVASAQIKDYQAWVAEPALPESVVDIGLRGQPNRELAASLNLDLILISPLFSAIEPTLSQIAPVQTLTTYNPENNFWQNLVDTTRQVGKLTNRSAEAEAVIDHHRLRISRLKKHITEGTPSLLVVQFIDDRHVRAYGKGSLYDMVINRLGLQNAWKGQTNMWGYTTVGIEKLTTQGYLVIVDPIPMSAEGVFEDNKLWQALPAVRSDRVLSMPAVWSFGALPSAVRFAEELYQALSEQRAIESDSSTL
ncbi:iron-siderophore ABC transporter substrate-binding protein [Marinobacter salexigens]|uniref:Iron-siderophore ABC transporter substrate-binding protein n=1 Tax=Marinobacter salexigens TaxID=1925763 RepID=A0ABS6ABY8_9GAMM|nr:iron-siderophore ABC transporter substrate-binding protein [Marinobacter salexigens]MBU2875666.1 iron-siderophore ABC transporter substrate-binding protein [Marinobacter salexigens]